MGLRHVTAGGEVDEVVQQVDLGDLGDLLGPRLQGGVRVVGRQVDHAHRGGHVVRCRGPAQVPQVHGEGVRGGGARSQRGDLGQDAAADQLRADAAAGLAVGHRGGHDHDHTAAGRGVGVGVLEPGQFALRAGRRAEFPAGVEEQFLPAPVGVAHRRIAHDQVGLDLGPPVGAQGVALFDVDVGPSGEIAPCLGEPGAAGVRFLAVPADARGGAHGEEEGADAAGGVEQYGVGRHLPGEVADGADHSGRGDLVGAGTAYGVREALGEVVHHLGGGMLRRQAPGEVEGLLREGGGLVGSPGGEGLGDVGEAAEDVVAVGAAQHLPQVHLVGDVLSLALLVQPGLHLGQVEQRAVGPAAGRCREVVVPPSPVGHGGTGDTCDAGDLGTGYQRVRRRGRGLWHAATVHSATPGVQ